LDDVNIRRDGGGVMSPEPTGGNGIEREQSRLLLEDIRDADTQPTGDRRIAALLERGEKVLNESSKMRAGGEIVTGLDQQTLLGIAGRSAHRVEVVDLVKHFLDLVHLGPQLERNDQRVLVEESALIEVLDDPFPNGQHAGGDGLLLVELLEEMVPQIPVHRPSRILPRTIIVRLRLDGRANRTGGSPKQVLDEPPVLI